MIQPTALYLADVLEHDGLPVRVSEKGVYQTSYFKRINMTQLNISKDHLIPVGTKKRIKSDRYGNYVMRCVANLDLFPPEITTTEFLSWVDKFHPKNLGVGYKIVGSNFGEEDRFISVLFVMKEDNLDWYVNNKDSKYVQQVKRKVPLPIACTNKELQNFLQGSKKLLLP